MPLDLSSPTSRRTRLGALLAAAGLVTAGAVAAPAAAATNDPLRDQQWGLDQINAEEAWTATTGEGAVVAVVDSGVEGCSKPDPEIFWRACRRLGVAPERQGQDWRCWKTCAAWRLASPTSRASPCARG